MFSIPNLILGIIGISGGIAITYYAYYINHHLLFLGWVEQKWGPGMGTTAYRLIGLAVTIFGFFVLIGRIDLFTAAFGGGGGSSPTSSQRVQVQQAPSGGGLLSQ
jgi:hypothetical protein